MNREPALEADGLAALTERPPVARLAPDIVARGEEVAGVDADPDPLGARRTRQERSQLFERPADRMARARSVLERDPDRVTRCPPSHLVQGGHDPWQARGDPGPHVRPGVHGAPGETQPPRPLQLAGEGV